MKKLAVIVIGFGLLATIGCRAGKGCPSNGRNIGAERLMSGDPKAMKLAKKAGKFKH